MPFFNPTYRQWNKKCTSAWRERVRMWLSSIKQHLNEMDGCTRSIVVLYFNPVEEKIDHVQKNSGLGDDDDDDNADNKDAKHERGQKVSIGFHHTFSYLLDLIDDFIFDVCFYYNNRKRSIRIYCCFIADAVDVVVVVVGAAAVVFLHLMNESKQNQLVFRFIVGIEIYAFP